MSIRTEDRPAGTRRALHPVDGTRDTHGLWFDWAMVGLSGWFVAGLYVDGWAHHHGMVDESFFTPWHAILYSGFGAVAAFLVLMLLRDRRPGSPWAHALPAGYELSLLGSGIFLAGGVADMFWHILFGIELGVEALYSPSHLVLALGMTLIVTGPFRAAWRRSGSGTISSALPMLLSLAFTLSILTFFTQVAHPFVRPRAAGISPREEPLVFFQQALGIAGVLLQTALLMGLVLLVVRRWTLPPGGLTLILVVNATAMSVLNDQYRLIVPAALAGLSGEVLRYRLRPSMARRRALRVFAVAVPLLFFLLYFLTLILTLGVWWSIHLWTGAITLAGIAGWLISYLVAPPSSPDIRDVADRSLLAQTHDTRMG